MTSALTSSPTTKYAARPIPASTLQELRRSDDSGQPLQPYFAGAVEAPIDSVDSPLRCCLRAIRPGERVALVSYAPLRRWAAATGAAPGAYDEAGPVFIHADDCPGPGQLTGYPHARPGALRTIRRYDAAGHIVGGRLFEIGEDPTTGFDRAFDDAFTDPAVVLVHVRALEYGCFQFEVCRDNR